MKLNISMRELMRRLEKSNYLYDIVLFIPSNNKIKKDVLKEIVKKIDFVPLKFEHVGINNKTVYTKKGEKISSYKISIQISFSAKTLLDVTGAYMYSNKQETFNCVFLKHLDGIYSDIRIKFFEVFTEYIKTLNINESLYKNKFIELDEAISYLEN